MPLPLLVTGGFFLIARFEGSGFVRQIFRPIVPRLSGEVAQTSGMQSQVRDSIEVASTCHSDMNSVLNR
jgi:hypothetical protein